MNWLLKNLFFLFIVKPFVLVFLGLNIRHHERLPKSGPAVLVANHNSHLDTIVLMSLFSSKLRNKLRPVAAADYFLKNPLLSWFSTKIIGIIPFKRVRSSHKEDLFSCLTEAINEKSILIFFPEGTRGNPECMVEFKKGIAHFIAKNPNLPVVPIFLHGLGKSLPKGSWLPIPFFCDVFIGETLGWTNSRETYMEKLNSAMKDLSTENYTSSWI